MKRFLPAVIIAILFHAALFALDPGLIMKRPGKIQKPAITVTMSYRKKPAPPPTVKKPPEIKNCLLSGMFGTGLKVLENMICSPLIPRW